MKELRISIDMTEAVKLCDYAYWFGVTKDIGGLKAPELIWKDDNRPEPFTERTYITCLDGSFYGVGIDRLKQYLSKEGVDECPVCNALIFTSEFTKGIGSDPCDTVLLYHCDFCDYVEDEASKYEPDPDAEHDRDRD